MQIHNNTFDHNSTEVVGSNTLQSGVVTGKIGLLSQSGFTGGELFWSPYGGNIVPDNVTFNQNNSWYANTYRGNYSFMPHDTGTSKTPSEWQASPYYQDAGSAFTATPVSHGTNTTVYRAAPPATCTATPGNAQAKVEFPPSLDWGGDAIVGYTATSSPGGLTASAIGSPIVVSGLTNNTAYTFTVKSRSALGLSTTSSSASGSVTPTSGNSVNANGAPWQPVKPYVFKRGSNAEVHFFAPYTTNGAAVTQYTVTTSPGGGTTTGSSSPITVTGLSAGTYTFTVKATNSNGTGPESLPTNAVTI